MKRSYRTTACCLLLLSSYFASAQTDVTGAWNIISFKLNLDKKWSLFSEAQLRSQRFYDEFSYYEMKGGVSVSFKKNFSALAGFGRYMTYSNGDNFKKPFVNREWRMWEQFGMNSYLDRVKFENRYRIEQRWTSAGYRNRFRYKLSAVVPVNHKKIDPGTFYISVADEVFFSNKKPNFEQNRFFAGGGYELSKHVTLQSGYLYQLAYRVDNTSVRKGYFQVSVIIEADAHKEHVEKDKSHNVTD